MLSFVWFYFLSTRGMIYLKNIPSKVTFNIVQITMNDNNIYFETQEQCISFIWFCRKSPAFLGKLFNVWKTKKSLRSKLCKKLTFIVHLASLREYEINEPILVPAKHPGFRGNIREKKPNMGWELSKFYDKDKNWKSGVQD